MAETIRFYRSTGEFGFLSNLFGCAVQVQHDVFCPQERIFGSAEHAYQFGKSSNPRIAEDIARASYPRVAAIIGHGLFPYDVRPGWNAAKRDWMFIVVRAKFIQNPELADRLVATAPSDLVEASKTDAYWGIGKKGDGKNHLGKILMEIREGLICGGDAL